MSKHEENSIHQGHRKRMKDRFLEQGLDGFNEVQVLELLLFFVIPIKDTNLIAHALLERFGTLHQVLDAPVKELVKIDGIGTQAATLLKLTTQVSRRYEVSRINGREILHSTELCARHLIPHFVGRRDEVVFLLCLDSKCMELSCTQVGRGSVNAAGISVRKIVETALEAKATSVVLAHNHPSGLAIPSAEDIATTRRVAVALDAVGIFLADHIVVADDDYVSLLDSNLYRPEECRVPL